VIDLKDHPVAPIENANGYPLAFARPGVKKVLENERVIVWDCTWTLGVATPMHFHDKDVVALLLEDGDLKSTTPDGQSVVNSYTSPAVRFNLRNRTHTEMLVRGKQHAIFTELKQVFRKQPYLLRRTRASMLIVIGRRRRSSGIR
jgi:hypothetical protein